MTDRDIARHDARKGGQDAKRAEQDARTKEGNPQKARTQDTRVERGAGGKQRGSK